MPNFVVMNEGLEVHLKLCTGEAAGWNNIIKASSKLTQESLQSTASQVKPSGVLERRPHDEA